MKSVGKLGSVNNAEVFGPFFSPKVELCICLAVVYSTVRFIDMELVMWPYPFLTSWRVRWPSWVSPINFMSFGYKKLSTEKNVYSLSEKENYSTNTVLP